MDKEVNRLLNRLTAQGSSTEEFFQELPSDHFETKIYSEGSQWTIRQILAHFVNAEDGIRRLVEYIIQGGEGVPEDFDIDAHNEKEVDELDEETPEVLLKGFKQNRQKTIQFVSSLSDTDLEKVGRHPWLGVTTVNDMLKLMYRHNQIHQRDIRKSLVILEQD